MPGYYQKDVVFNHPTPAGEETVEGKQGEAVQEDLDEFALDRLTALGFIAESKPKPAVSAPAVPAEGSTK